MTTLKEKPAKNPPDVRHPGGFRAPLRPHVLGAIFVRDFLGYFSNPAGYVFITLFVLVCSWAEFWQPAFFANNLANLAPLNEWMPYILLFFIPAITMATWAEERKQGTEELILTLPARDVEVVLGKYLAAVGIYTVALLFLALGHTIILGYLGRPDPGVLAANFLGFWLVGAMLIAIGMVASVLSGNATVAFILGALFGGIPVFARLIGSPTAGPTRRFIEGLSVSEQFRDLGTGVVPLSAVVYFLTLAAAMLYLNMVLLGRRHWAGGEASRDRWVHAAARVAAVVVALISLDVIVQKSLGSARADLTEERLHTLSPATRGIIREIPRNRPVYIEAYISPEVPREYVQTRLDLISTLKEFAAIGADRIRLNIVPTDRYSEAERNAQKRYGIAPRPVRTIDAARQDVSEITLGVAITSGLEEVVIPFFDRGLPVEYELARSVRTASGARRKRIGVLDTDAKVMGGMDFRSMSPESSWQIIGELKKQYEVTAVAPDAPIPADLDALIVAQPSSLTRRQIPNLRRYIHAGGPTLLMVDPVPALVDVPDLNPREPRRGPGGMMGGMQQQPEPKGDLKPLMNMLGIVWPDDEIVWNSYNPHPKYPLGPETVFISRNSTNQAFGRDPTSQTLQEVLLVYPGALYPLAGAATQFLPLLRTDDLGGTIAYDEAYRPGMFGPTPVADPPRVPSLQPMTLAARVTGKLAPEPDEPTPRGAPKPDKTPKANAPGAANVIVVADLDFITDQIFRLRLKPVEALDELDFDNVSFFLNCVDSLAGDETFIPLRSRRPKHRTLQAVEEQSRRYVKEADEASRKADQDAKADLDAVQKRFDQQVEAIRSSKDLDERDKEATLSYRKAVEERRLSVTRAEIEDRKKRRIEDARVERMQAVQSIQNGIRVWALILPPLPALLLGGLVFFVRSRNENLGATPARLA